MPHPGFPPPCDANLFFGFFFDGTNNNMKRDLAFHSHSNVARLYHAFPGGKDTHGSEAWPDLETKYHKSYFRTYVPGVGTRFDEVGDTGEGFSILTSDRARGLAFAYKGEIASSGHWWKHSIMCIDIIPMPPWWTIRRLKRTSIRSIYPAKCSRHRRW